MRKSLVNSCFCSVARFFACFFIVLFLQIICLIHQAQGEQKYIETAMDPAKKGIAYIYHEGINEVPVSNKEINRIVSDQEIHNIKLPKSARITVEGSGHNAFLEVKGTKSELIYITTETMIYAIKVKPTQIGAQKLQLVHEKKEKIIVPLIGNERENLAVQLIKAAYTEGKLLDKARVTRLSEKKRLIKDIEIRAYRRYDWQEDNLTMTLYILRLGKNFAYEHLEISEKMFLIPELCEQPLGISLTRDYLTKKEYTRLFVVGRN